jgi:hypothetical protein
MVEKSLEVKPEVISTETPDLIYDKKLFLSQKVKYMLLSSKKWMTESKECDISEFKKLKSKYIYEYYPSGDMIFVVDVDKKVNPEEIRDGMEDSLLKEAIERLERDLNVCKEDCGISSYHRVTEDSKYKISYHITIPKIRTDKESLKRYTEENGDIFDKQFTSRGFLRGPLSKKPFEINGRPKIEQGSIDDFVLCDISRCEREYRYKKKEERIEAKLLEKKSENVESKREEKYRTILSGLKDARADEYEDWIKVGMICKNELGESGYDLWYDFSRRSKKFKGHTETVKKWESFNERKEVKLGEGSLMLMLKEDNKKLFNQLSKMGYPEMKKEVEKEWFFLLHPTFICREYDREIQYKTVNDTKTVLAPYKIGDERFVNIWMEDPERRTYEKIVFDPKNKCPKNHYNEFRGFKYDRDIKYRIEELEPIMKVLNHVLGNHINFFLDWAGWIVQKPYKKTGVAILLYSEMHGVGKNSAIELLMKILEGYTAKLESIDDIKKNFNSHFANKLLCYGDEIKARAKDLSNDIKNIITRTEINVEKKGIDTKKTKDYLNYIITTNNELTLTIEESDRRIEAIECPNVKLDQNVYKNFYESLENEDLIIKFTKFLKEREIPDVLEPTKSEYKQRLIMQTLPAYIQMVYKEYEYFANCKYSLKEISEKAKQYGKNNHLSLLFTDEKIAKEFKKEFIEFFKKGKTGNYYEFPDKNTLFKKLSLKKPEMLIENY